MILDCKKGLKFSKECALVFINYNKVWEIRSQYSRYRGKLALVCGDTVFATADMVDCIRVTEELYNNNYQKHCIFCPYNLLPDGYKYGWIYVFENLQIVPPTKFKTKRGQQTWVTL